MTVLQDLSTLVSKMKSMYRSCGAFLFRFFSSFGKIGNIFKRNKKAFISESKVQKRSIVRKIKDVFTPKAKLTYWLADEEVIVYVTKFTQRDKYKILYTEIETGRQVMVNSAEPINYRLEELKSTDTIQPTKIQQNQRY